ncbi:MAG: hypothetical protein ABJN62_19545 [Halioglobus sp.]
MQELTIQDLGSIGELLAAIATIATLAYLAAQIRQNTHTVRAATTTAHTESVSVFSRLLGQSQELSDLYFTGLAGEVELSESQQRQFHMLLSGFLMAIQQAYLLDEEGIVHPEIKAYHAETIDWLAEQPGFTPFWDAWGKTFPPSFRHYIEGKLN